MPLAELLVPALHFLHFSRVSLQRIRHFLQSTRLGLHQTIQLFYILLLSLQLYGELLVLFLEELKLMVTLFESCQEVAL